MGFMDYFEVEKTCSCCNKKKPAKGYIQVEAGWICPDCVKLICMYQEEMQECSVLETEPETEKKGIKKWLLKPTEIKNRLDTYVIGQEKAKKCLAIAVYNHYKRLEINDSNIRKSNILMIGPTGSGKTYLLQTLAKEVLDVPLVIADATSLTEAGYIGEDVENILARLLDAAEGDVERAERGIVFIDEIDKLAAQKSTTHRQVGGKGVQQALLKILEGTKVEVPVMTNNRNGLMSGSSSLKATINTDNILFICGGAFPDMEEIIHRRIDKKATLGFQAPGKSDEEKDKTDIFSYVEQDDLIEFGMIPELLGRLPIVTTLEKFSVEALKNILTKPKGCLVEQYCKLLAYDGIQLRFDDSAIERIAELAIRKGTGARALRSIMENVLEDVMYMAPSDDEIDTILINKDFVDKTQTAQIIPKARSMMA